MRSLRHWGLIAAFAGGVLVTAAATPRLPAAQKQGGVTVAPAWKLDAAFGQSWETTATQTVTVTNKTDKKSKLTKYTYTVKMDVTWTPAKTTGTQEEAKRKLTLKVNSVSVSGTVTPDGGTAETAKADDKGPAAAALAALKGVEIPVTIDTATMAAEIGAAELAKATDDAVGKASGAADKAAVRAVLAADALKHQIAVALPKLPTKKEEPTKLAGQTIKGAFGDYAVEGKYDFDKEDGGKLTLKPSATWTYTPPAGAVAGAKIQKADPAKVELSGDASFDPAAGLKATLKTKENTKQTFEMTVGDVPYEVVVAIDYTMKVEPTQK